jgi:hypothetical protein
MQKVGAPNTTSLGLDFLNIPTPIWGHFKTKTIIWSHIVYKFNNFHKNSFTVVKIGKYNELLLWNKPKKITFSFNVQHLPDTDQN